jgi:hypothetical protein
MLRSATVVLAILVVLGSFSLSAGAFARDGGYAGAAGPRGNNFCGSFGSAPGDGYSNRASGLRGESRSCEGRDVWGRWGAYYGPMIPMI